MKIAFAAAALAASISAMPAQAALLGDTIECLRNGTTGCNPATTTVGDGVEFTQGAGTFDFTDTGLILTLTSGRNTDPLNYSFTNSTMAFTSFSDLTVEGGTFDSSLVTLTDGVLNFALGGIDPVDGTRVTLTLSTAAAVPEPATWGMMLLGFGLAGVALRRTRKSPTVLA